MEIHLAVNALPLLSILAFLSSLRTDPGKVWFGEEVYPGELKLWGVLFRLFCVAAFFRFRVLWPVIAYAVSYALLGELGRGVELAAFAILATMLSGYRDTIIKNLSRDRSKAPNTPNSALPWTPFSGLTRRSLSSTAGKRGIRARSKSPAAGSRRRPQGTPVRIDLEDPQEMDLQLNEPAKQTSKNAITPLILPTSDTPTSSSTSKSSGGKASLSLEELKQQKQQQMQLRLASKARAMKGGGASS